MDQDVERFVTNCQHYRTSDKSLFNHDRPSPMRSVACPDKSWEKMALDIIGPINTVPPKCHYAINLIDYRSRSVEVGFTTTVHTADVIAFLNMVWSREGFPGEMVTTTAGDWSEKSSGRIYDGVTDTLDQLYTGLEAIQ